MKTHFTVILGCTAFLQILVELLCLVLKPLVVLD